MASSALAFATMNFLAHVASEHAHWSMVVAVRALVGAGVAYGVARARGVSFRVKNRSGILLRSASGTVAMLCTFYALGVRSLALGDAVTLLNLAPVFVAVLAPFVLREKPERSVAVALPLALAGTVLIVKPEMLLGAGPMSQTAVVGALVAVAGAFFSSVSYAILRRIGPGESPEAVALNFAVLSLPVLCAIAAVHATIPDPATLAEMIGAGALGGYAQIALTRAYSLERAARVSGLSYLNVVASSLLGAVALHEWPTTRTVSGMVLVVGAGLVLTFASLREAREQAS
jgi:drug/metabolite transporter (DMT)-like permease